MLYLAAAAQAAAGNFSVSPVRIDLSGTQPTAVVTVHNNAAAPLLVQASTLSWAQPAGEESYAETKDILATPTVFTLPPDGDQIVRVAPTPRRAFQGWRYLDPKDAPPDLDLDAFDGVPEDLARQLREAGAW